MIEQSLNLLEGEREDINPSSSKEFDFSPYLR